MNKKETAEIVIIGGGVIGTAVAAYLAQEGMDVALVERGEFASGSSRRCDGHVVTYDSPPGYFSQLCKFGQDLFYKISPLLDCDIEFTPEGLGLLVDDENDMDTVLETMKGKTEEGLNVVLWDRKELKYHEPNIADNVLACLNFMGDAKLNPMRLAFGLGGLAQKHKAKIFTRTSVTGLEVHNGTLQAVKTSQGTITTNKAVLAAGVWTPELGQLAGVNIPVRPRQGQILVTERLQGLVGKNYAEYGYLAAKGGRKRSGVTPAMEEYGVAFVVEPSHAGTVLIGSSRRFVGLDTCPHPAVMQAIAQRAMRFFPKFSQTRIIRSYAGLRPASPDGKPIISPTHVQGLYVASGHEGNGIGLSLVTGLLCMQMICGKETSLDIEPLRLDRFEGTAAAQNN